MISDYEVVLSRPACDFFVACRIRERDQLARFFDSLASSPTQRSHGRRKAADGRWHEVTFIRPFEVTWWIDVPVKEVRVVRICQV